MKRVLGLALPAVVLLLQFGSAFAAPDPVLSITDWTTLRPPGVPAYVRFHFHWVNDDAQSSTEPATGTVYPQPFGVFQPDGAMIGTFDVPSIPPNSAFDAFLNVPLTQLPPSAGQVLPGGGPGPGSPCLPDDHWDGNVEVHWSAASGSGIVTWHQGKILVCPGAGCSLIHVVTGCAAPAPWVLTGICPGFTAKLVDEDQVTPAPNPVPPDWSGYVCISAAAGTPDGAICCFKLTFACDGAPGVIELCATACDWGPRNPTLGSVDWTTVPGPGGNDVKFTLHWTNDDPFTPTSAISGSMKSQPFGVFMSDFGSVGPFSVPEIGPGGSYDAILEVPIASLPATAPKIVPNGGPNPSGPCPPDGHWDGNVDITWSGNGGAGQTTWHNGTIQVCRGSTPSLIHVTAGCPDPAGSSWTVLGLCPGFTATMVEADHVTPAPNPVPPNWSGYIAVSAAASVPVGTTCCFTVEWTCAGSPARIHLCATACDCGPNDPALGTTDWTTTNVGGVPTVQFRLHWTNGSMLDATEAISGTLYSQPFGVFQQNYGTIGTFNVPSLAPQGSTDVYVMIPLSQLPPSAQKMTSQNGALRASLADTVGVPCPPDTHWDGNVDVVWSGATGGGESNWHNGTMQVCPGGGNSLIHVVTNCTTASAPWTVSAGCPGWTLQLFEEDMVTPAPNPVPPGWHGWISVGAASSVPVGSACCFTLTFVCDGTPGVIYLCATACDCAPHNPTLGTVDWSTVPGPSGNDVKFRMHWVNDDPANATDPMTGNMMSQQFGVFLPDFGSIGSFNVPGIPPAGSTDVYVEVPMSQLPPLPPMNRSVAATDTFPTCPPQTEWNGNVDIRWTGTGGSGQSTWHKGSLYVCPGAGCTYLHVLTDCAATTGATWSVSGVCSGFTVKLLEEDRATPAANPVPPGWTGYLCVEAAATVPVGTTCCATLTFSCGGVPGVIQVCATACDCSQNDPALGSVDWTTVQSPTGGQNVQFTLHWVNPSRQYPTEHVMGSMAAQPFGVFLADAGTIGPIDVPPIEPGGTYDATMAVPMGQLPPTAEEILPGGGPDPNGPCPPDGHWDGNVDIMWTGAGGPAQVLWHKGTLLVDPGAGASLVHVMTNCTTAGAAWTLSGPCPGFSAKLLEADKTTPAPNPLPPGPWDGYIAISAPITTPSGTTCCFVLTFDCGGVPGTIELCATTCNLSISGAGTEAGPVTPGIRTVTPNPSSGSVSIRFGMVHAGPARLEVFDAGGRRVREISQASLPAGMRSITWDGRSDDGRALASGIYFLKVTGDRHQSVRKVVLVR